MADPTHPAVHPTTPSKSASSTCSYTPLTPPFPTPSSFKCPYPSPVSPPIIHHHPRTGQPILSRSQTDQILSLQNAKPFDANLPSSSTLSSADSDSSQLRRQWLSMLHAVLTGDILRKETQRLFNTTIWTDPDEKHALWIALKAVARGNSVYQQLNWIQSQRVNINRYFDEFMAFIPDKSLSFDATRSQVSAQLQQLDSLLDLYPTERAFRADNPRWQSPKCQEKLDLIQTWLNLIYELSISIGVFYQWFDSDEGGSKDNSSSIDESSYPPKFHSHDFYEPNTILLGKITPNKFPSSLTLDPSKILDSLVRGYNFQLPIERRFAQELPRYLKRLKSTIVQYAGQFDLYNLPIPSNTISKLAELPLRVMQELLTIRLTYAEKIQLETPALVDQLLNDFKVTLVVGMKARQEFLDFFLEQPNWALPSNGAGKTFEGDLFRFAKQYFRLLEKALNVKQPGMKAIEYLESEWLFCSVLVRTADPVGGLDLFMVDSFCFLCLQRFEFLRQLYLEIVEGSARLDQHLDVLKYCSRTCKRFFSLLVSHLCRVVPLVLNRESFTSSPDSESPSYQYSPLSPRTRPASRPDPCEHFHDPNVLNVLERRPSFHSLQVFVSKLFDTGYHLLGHTNEDVYFFSRNRSLDVLDFVCTLPCNNQASTWSSVMIVVYFPGAPPNLNLTHGLLISPRSILNAGADNMMGCVSNVSKSFLPNFEQATSDAKQRYSSSLSPSEMLSSVLMVGSCDNSVISACNEFQDLIPPLLKNRSMAFTRRTQLVVMNLEACISRYAFSLLNGTNLIKNHHSDMITESLYSFVSDFSLRFCRVSKSQRLLHRLLIFTVEWIKFTCVVYANVQLKEPNSKTYRWGLRALEYVLDLCRMGELLNPERSHLPDGAVRGGKVDNRILDVLADKEFHMLQAAVSHCMALLISHFESFSPNLKFNTEPTEPTFSPQFLEATVSKMKELESKRACSMRANRLIGRVLDRSASEQSLASLSSSPSSISIRWQSGKYLGGGTYGSVYLGINLSTGDLMAVKEIRIHNTANFISLKRMVSDEMKVMEQINHPHIIAYYGIEVHCDKVYIFMEYAPGGTLSDLVDEGGLEEVVIKRFIYEILLGLQYLHSLRIVHRDIKPDNILIDSQGKLKLVDFGASKILSNQETLKKPASLTGTPNYLAPELVMGSSDKNLGAQDIWSLGCTMYELYTGTVPWSHLDNQWSILYHAALSPPPMNNNFKASKEGKEFLLLCFTLNPLHRPSATKLLAHPFLAEETKRHSAPF